MKRTLESGKYQVPALVVAKRPKRRQGHPARQRRVAGQNAFRIRAVDEVVVQLPAVGTERQESGRLVTDIEVAAERVVEKDSVAAAGAQHEKERHRHVDGIGYSDRTRRCRCSTSCSCNHPASFRACSSRPSSNPTRTPARRLAAASTHAPCCLKTRFHFADRPRPANCPASLQSQCGRDCGGSSSGGLTW